VSAPWRSCSLLVGAAFGFFLTASGLGDYQTIHRGLLLEDSYIYLMMAATVTTAWLGLTLLKRVGRTAFAGPIAVPRHSVRRPTIYGASVFGVAFAVGATCPGITVAMLATGGLYGTVVLAGIFGGLWLRGVVASSGRSGLDAGDVSLAELHGHDPGKDQ
jgi:hypothetical protein